MDFGIVLLSVIPLRFEPDDRSEMINQLLFGDLLVITEKKKNWWRIRSVFDNYEGWVDNKQVQLISEEEFNSLKQENKHCSLDPVSVVKNKTTGHYLPVVMGSSMPGIKDQLFTLNGTEYLYEGGMSQEKFSREHLIETALLYVDAPYLWGGKTPFGIDCSGLIQMIFKINGHAIERDASQQAKMGETLSLLSETKAGDLVFFDNEDGEIIHVGMLLTQEKVIHASGKVRIDSIDHHGIFNAELKNYTHNIRLIKSLI